MSLAYGAGLRQAQRAPDKSRSLAIHHLMAPPRGLSLPG
jgi:hypothetical protein